MVFKLVVSSTFGVTLVYNIPVGLGFIGEEDRPFFTKGILLGLTAMPFAITAGGLVMGLSIGSILWNSLPVLLISALLAVGVIFKPDVMMKGFQCFGNGIKIVGTLGLTVAAVTHLTGITLIPAMPPLQDAMKTVSSICIVMLGSMPLVELIQRMMKKPFQWISEKTGLNGASTTALIIGLVSATPALAMISMAQAPAEAARRKRNVGAKFNRNVERGTAGAKCRDGTPTPEEAPSPFDDGKRLQNDKK